ncbi:hypothetical protein B0H10DRAFT_2206358 [Mycena sp. CBHHK59/15]|nr:hypothetical protein B0H10DRAFT_2206358 [Mycena sp. CBHHK59/15]
MTTGVFGKCDVVRVEHEFLEVLDFELWLTEDDLLAHHEGLAAAAFPTHHHHHKASAVASHRNGTAAASSAVVPDLQRAYSTLFDDLNVPHPSVVDSHSASIPVPLSPSMFVESTAKCPAQPRHKPHSKTLRDVLRHTHSVPIHT